MAPSSSSLVRLPAAAASAFGKYRLVAKLGQGGMAEVFLAAHQDPPGFQKLVVIKRLKGAIAADPELSAMFLDEARIAARLNHPHLVHAHELGSVEDQHYLAMEYLDGQPLDRIIHRLGHEGRLAIYLAILSDALAGLHHAHELCDFDGKPLNVVHRDVSPHNIFVTYAGQVKVVDFGIAKWASRSAEATSTGVVKGKISYMAPEQALSAPLDRRADLFAVGVILWEAAAGERFWEGLSEVQILQRMAFGDMPDLGRRRPDARDDLQRICGRALSVEPAGRYATAAEMRDAIEALLAELGRRPTAAEIGQLVAEAFADRRVEAKEIIGEQLGRLRADEAAIVDEESLPVLDDRAGPVSVRGRSASQRREPAPPAAPTPASPVAEPPASVAPHRARRGAALATLIVAAVAGAGALAALQGLTGGPPPPPAAAAAVRAQATETETETEPRAAPAPAPAPAPQPRLIELRVAATPASAKIFLDDVEVPSNPFAAKFPRDGTGHRIRAEADGYAPEARLVVFDADVRLDLALGHAETAPASPALRPAALVERGGSRALGGAASTGVTGASARAGAVPAVAAGNGAPRQGGGDPEPAASAGATLTPGGPKVDATDPWAPKP